MARSVAKKPDDEAPAKVAPFRHHSLRTRLIVAEMTGRLPVNLSPHKARAREGLHS